MQRAAKIHKRIPQHNRLIRLCTVVLMLLAFACLTMRPAHADMQFIKRYYTNDSGAITFTGNTLGLAKMTVAGIEGYGKPWYSHPGASNGSNTTDDIGAFISSKNSASATAAWPAYTTLDWKQNCSDAILHFTGKVLYAELIWGGSKIYGSPMQGDPANATDVTAYLDTPVSFYTPNGGPYSIAPDAATKAVIPPPTGDGQQYYYLRSANVTSYVQAAGIGTYSCGGVPATITWGDDSHNCAGWTLAVVYEDTSLPVRNMTLYVGFQLVSPSSTAMTPVVVSGFNTPSYGTFSSRMMVSALEGDPYKSGDQMKIGQTQASLAAVSGTNNPLNNFFCSAINGDSGSLDTSGSFGSYNSSPTGSGYTSSYPRQGYDITNIDVSAQMALKQTQAWMQGTTSSDGYAINALGFQIDVATPKFPVTSPKVDKTATYVGDTLTYTVTLDNSATNSVDANNVIFSNIFPQGVTFIPGTFTLNGVTQAGADPTGTVALGTVAKGSKMVVTFQGKVNMIPPPPAPAEFDDYAKWTYTYQSDYYLPVQNGSVTTSIVATFVPRLLCVKACSSTDKMQYGQKYTYTITAQNYGTTDTGAAALVDPIPTGVSYVAGTTTLNGTAVADVNGQMPFAAGKSINSPSGGSGVIKVGETATIVFQVLDNTQQPPPIVTNVASVYPNGISGPAPAILSAVSNPVQNTDLGVTITDNQTTAIPGNPITYAVTLTNYGPVTVNSVFMPVTLPPSIFSPTFTPSAGTYSAATGNWTGLTLASGQSIVLTIAGKVDPAATGTLTASVSVSPPAGIGDTVSSNNSASDTDTLTQQVNLSITKAANPATYVLPGSTIIYTMIVTNAGPSTINSITLVDNYDTGKLSLGSPPPEPFIPSQGTYNMSNGVWTGLMLAPNQSVTLTLTATVNSSATGTLDNSATVSPPAGVIDTNPNNTATVENIIGAPGSGVSGTVYADINHNGLLDYGETGSGLSSLYVNLLQGTTLKAFAQVDPVSGLYALANVSAGSYTLVLTNSSSNTNAVAPAGWLATSPTTLTRSITVVSGTALPSQNFGLWNGSKISGVVFVDNGQGTGGRANDGIQNGTEFGLATVKVTLVDNAGTTDDSYATANDGSYSLWLPANDAGSPVKIAAAVPSGYLAISGTPGTTGGTFDRPSVTTTFTFTSGTSYTGTNFGLVPVNVFQLDGHSTAAPGSAIFYPHTFTAGTGGQVTFTTVAAASPASVFWTNVIYQDLNNSGVYAPGDPLITGPITVSANQTISILVKEYVPPNAPNNAQDLITVSANFSFTNSSPALIASYTHTDLTLVAPQDGMQLVKSVDKTTAKSGDTITYTIAYKNICGTLLQTLTVYDDTPAFTTFLSASYGTLPQNLTACTMTLPSVGGTGSLSWTFTGSLVQGQSGSVSYKVKLQ